MLLDTEVSCQRESLPLLKQRQPFPKGTGHCDEWVQNSFKKNNFSLPVMLRHRNRGMPTQRGINRRISDD
jgi:hypothetical protein